MRAIYKVPNGKLLKISLEKSDDNIITELKIMGDFFVYPEEDIEELEKQLIGSAFEESALTERANTFLQKHKTELFGVDIESLIKTILAVN
jgi:lipoate---protein ligase